MWFWLKHNIIFQKKAIHNIFTTYRLLFVVFLPHISCQYKCSPSIYTAE